MIPNWSFSTLMQYETCPLRVKLDKLDKLPKPERKADDPLERGNREHRLFERYIKGELPDLSGSTAKAMTTFQPLFHRARALYAGGHATAEQDWLFDADWFETTRANVWLWSKLDLCVHDDDTVVVCDFKTGKNSPFKAVEYIQQLQLYAAVAALKYPQADTIHAELWFVDAGEIKATSYTQEQALSYVSRFDTRAKKLMHETIWPARPNRMACKWCPFGAKNGTGACPVGV